jgi:riboflavin transporter FmnP
MAAYGGANGCIQHGHPTDGAIVAALVAGQAALDAQLTAHQSALESAIIAQGPLTVTATVFNNGELCFLIPLYIRIIKMNHTSNSSLVLVYHQS